MKHILLGLLLVGCSSSSARQTDAGDTGSGGAGGPGTDGGAGIIDGGGGLPNGFTLTSSTFAAGGTIPVADTCAGADTSPPLAWTGAPAGVKSFALALVDQTIGLHHWVIVDIAANATSLPAAVNNDFMPANVPGARQTMSDAANQAKVKPFGFAGPCPPSGKGAHTYQFTLYAIDTPTLGIATNTTATDAIVKILQHSAAMTTLAGTFSQ